MANPLITAAIRQTAEAALDSLMAPAEAGGLGKHCTLAFPPVRVRCPNCGWDNANRRSNSRYKSGGPQPFPVGGLCPVCNGKGSIDTPVTQDIVLLCNWNPKEWVRLPNFDPSNVNIQIPGGMLQTKGFLADVPRILQSRKLLVETAIQGIVNYTYELDGEPVDSGNIIQGRYFYAMWKRAGGT
jgi:hypothetical protein